jgi:type IV/VI secretion system ImpK/VasF family protein
MARTRLIHVFTPPLLRGLAILEEVQGALGTSRAPAIRPDQAVEELRRLFAQSMEEGRRLKAPRGELGRDAAAELKAAEYAVVALLDDRFGQLPSWRQRELDPLQFAMYGERGAGDDLFRRMEEAKESQAELKEVYALVLGLGFRGRAYMRDDASRRLLDTYRTGVRAGLQPEPVGAAELEGERARLTPQPYGVADPPERALPRPARWPLLAGLAAGLATLAVIGGGAWWWLTRGPDGPKEAEAALQGLACSAIQVEAVPGRGAAARLSGRYADRTALDARLARLREAGVEPVGVEGLLHRPPPLCEVLDLLDRRRVAGGAGAPTIDPGGTAGAYQIGEYFVAQATTPAAGHLTMFFLRARPGATPQIVPLLPGARQPPGPVAAGTALTAGRPGPQITRREPGLIVTGPEGPAALVTIVSPQPLFAAGTPPTTALPEFLAALDAGLARQPSRTDGRSEARASHAMLDIQASRDPLPRAQAALRGLSCSIVQASAGPGGSVRLTGRYADEAALARVLPAGITWDREELRLIPAPWCQALDDIELLTQTDPATAPRVQLLRASPRFAVGEDFEMDAIMTGRFAGHLTALYLHPTVGFVPLMPSAAHPAQVLPRGERVRIGVDAAGRRPWQFIEPTGPGMLLLLATGQPLLEAGQTLPRGVTEGIAALRAALQRRAASGDEILASYYMLTVLPRDDAGGRPRP